MNILLFHLETKLKQSYTGIKMNKINLTLSILVLTIASTLVTQATEIKKLSIGDIAPGFELKGADGKSYKLSDFKGKHVILEWTNFGCPFVKKHYAYGNMQKLQKRAVSQDIVWLSICSSAEGNRETTAEAAAAT